MATENELILRIGALSQQMNELSNRVPTMRRDVTGGEITLPDGRVRLRVLCSVITRDVSGEILQDKHGEFTGIPIRMALDE